MPIDYEQVMRAEFPDAEASYRVDDVILYHLGVGAGNTANVQDDLQYTYERGLTVLPSFAVVAPLGFNLAKVFKTPGLSVNPATILHAEQAIEIHRPLSPKARYKTSIRIADVFDLGKAALIVFQVNFRDESGKLMFSSRMSYFLRGEGGFGGPARPTPQTATPDRPADGVIDIPTLPQQALLYRLSGDKNPLHIDTSFAKKVGFDKPILHGLCSYGIAFKAIVDHVLKGDTERVTGYQARFAGITYPGETHTVSYWQEGNNIYMGSQAKERGTDIITHATITLKP
tara:strand:+ start:4886 stop:5743 length:858 start_codon:yes stop_codon:yes gene_type:complete